MAIIRKIAEPLTEDWKKNPAMISIMELDKKRARKAIKNYEEKLKNKKRAS